MNWTKWWQKIFPAKNIPRAANGLPIPNGYRLMEIGEEIRPGCRWTWSQGKCFEDDLSGVLGSLVTYNQVGYYITKGS